MSDFTVILADYSERSMSWTSPTTRVVQVEGNSPEDAAGTAEVVIASETWKRRHPNVAIGANPQMDDEWITCMESVGTLVVIEGHPKTFIDDDIYN